MISRTDFTLTCCDFSDGKISCNIYADFPKSAANNVIRLISHSHLFDIKTVNARISDCLEIINADILVYPKLGSIRPVPNPENIIKTELFNMLVLVSVCSTFAPNPDDLVLKPLDINYIEAHVGYSLSDGMGEDAVRTYLQLAPNKSIYTIANLVESSGIETDYAIVVRKHGDEMLAGMYRRDLRRMCYRYVSGYQMDIRSLNDLPVINSVKTGN